MCIMLTTLRHRGGAYIPVNCSARCAGSQEVGNVVARGHGGGVFLRLREVLDLPLQILVEAEDRGHVATPVAVVGR